jgi:hypothetical protein
MAKCSSTPGLHLHPQTCLENEIEIWKIKKAISLIFLVAGSVKAPAKTEDLIQSVLTGEHKPFFLMEFAT